MCNNPSLVTSRFVMSDFSSNASSSRLSIHLYGIIDHVCYKKCITSCPIPGPLSKAAFWLGHGHITWLVKWPQDVPRVWEILNSTMVSRVFLSFSAERILLGKFSYFNFIHVPHLTNGIGTLPLTKHDFSDLTRSNLALTTGHVDVDLMGVLNRRMENLKNEIHDIKQTCIPIKDKKSESDTPI